MMCKRLRQITSTSYGDTPPGSLCFLFYIVFDQIGDLAYFIKYKLLGIFRDSLCYLQSSYHKPWHISMQDCSNVYIGAYLKLLL